MVVGRCVAQSLVVDTIELEPPAPYVFEGRLPASAIKA